MEIQIPYTEKRVPFTEKWVLYMEKQVQYTVPYMENTLCHLIRLCPGWKVCAIVNPYKIILFDRKLFIGLMKKENDEFAQCNGT